MWIRLLAFAGLLLLGVSVAAQPEGDVRLAGGIIIPRGSFESYADEGPTVDLLGSIALGHESPFAAWLGLGGAFFKDDETVLPIYFDDLLIDGKKIVSQYAFTINAGLTLRPPIGSSSIRPYLLAGPGLYIFDTQTDYRIDDDDFDDQEPLYREHNSQVKFGLRAGAGLDLYFSSKWGLGFKYLFDSVIGLHQAVEVDENRQVITKSKNARFDSIMFEIVVPFSSFISVDSDDVPEDED